MNIENEALNPEAVAQYLQRHPDFFQHHAHIIASIVIPHPDGERTISLTERQLLSLREQNRMLENKLGQLMHLGRENEAIIEKMHGLNLILCAGTSLDITFNSLAAYLQKHFALHHVSIRLWSPQLISIDAPDNSNNLAFTNQLSDLKTLVTQLQTPYCGPLATAHAPLWLGAGIDTLHSQALIPLRTPSTDPSSLASLGVIALGACEPDRFTSSMGTQHLAYLGSLAAVIIRRLSISA